MQDETKIVSLESARSSNTICPLPWMHFSVALDTSIRVCCNTDNAEHIAWDDGKPVRLPELSSVKDYYNLPGMKEIRKKMMRGERPSYCNKCYKIEDAGGTSIRQNYLKQFHGNLESALVRTEVDGKTDPQIDYMDFSLGNHCNLKCRMCNPMPSNALRREFQEEGFPFDQEGADRARDGWELTDRFKNLIVSHLETVSEILTTGGEPFLSHQHLFLLEKAVEMGKAEKILLRYHTNLTLLPKRLLELWKHFRRVEIHVSLEGFGKVNEYIRYPARWNQIVSNLDHLLVHLDSLPLSVEIHTCFQAYNLLFLDRFFEFLQKYEGLIPVLPYPIWLDNPPHLQAAVLPFEVRRVGITRIQEFLKKFKTRLLVGKHSDFQRICVDNLESYLGLLETLPFDPENFNYFKSYTMQLDRRRKQNFLDLCPELTPYFSN